MLFGGVERSSWLHRMGGDAVLAGEIAWPFGLAIIHFGNKLTESRLSDSRVSDQSLRENELVTVSHAQAVITAAVLDQDFPRLAEELFGTQ